MSTPAISAPPLVSQRISVAASYMTCYLDVYCVNTIDDYYNFSTDVKHTSEHRVTGWNYVNSNVAQQKKTGYVKQRNSPNNKRSDELTKRVKK